MENDLSLGPDLAHDPSVKQVVQSPANTSAERYETRECYSGYDSPLTHRMPADERQSQRRMSSPGVMITSLKIKSSRSGRSRR